jgi:hypothetical protein
MPRPPLPPEDIVQWSTRLGTRVYPPASLQETGWRIYEYPGEGVMNWLLGVASDWVELAMSYLKSPNGKCFSEFYFIQCRYAHWVDFDGDVTTSAGASGSVRLTASATGSITHTVAIPQGGAVEDVVVVIQDRSNDLCSIFLILYDEEGNIVPWTANLIDANGTITMVEGTPLAGTNDFNGPTYALLTANVVGTGAWIEVQNVMIQWGL